MRQKFEVCIAALFLSATLGVRPAISEATPAFERIKALVGEWEGDYEWTGARSGGGKLTVSYYLTGNGTAVVENHIAGSEPFMTSVYHMDGNDLRMTHFCGAGNQPRLKSTSSNLEGGEVVKFEMIDITNLARPTAGHVNKVELVFREENHITLKMTFLADGRESIELIDVTRKP